MADDESFLLQLIAEISSNRPDIQRRYPMIKTTESRPGRYFFQPLAMKPKWQDGDKRARQWSFEVKLLLNRSNVLQTVSNSSWANFGYLVAKRVQDNTMKEQRILSTAHGIGLIRLNVADPSESEILIPARERSNVDWDASNRLAKENPDFMHFIKLVRQFHQTGELRAVDWDIPK